MQSGFFSLLDNYSAAKHLGLEERAYRLDISWHFTLQSVCAGSFLHCSPYEGLKTFEAFKTAYYQEQAGELLTPESLVNLMFLYLRDAWPTKGLTIGGPLNLSALAGVFPVTDKVSHQKKEKEH